MVGVTRFERATLWSLVLDVRIELTLHINMCAPYTDQTNHMRYQLRYTPINIIMYKSCTYVNCLLMVQHISL